MNWTGGRLSRGSRNASVKDKQRQHFARVRNNLLNDKPNPSPIRRNIFHEFPPFTELVSKPKYNPKFVRGAAESIQDESNISPVKYTKHHRTSDRDCSRREFAHHEASNDVDPPVARPRRESHDTENNFEASPSKVQKRHRRNSRNQSIEANDRPQISDDALDEIRLKLLQKRDWTGLKMQYPVKVKFSSAREKEMLGKRRRLPESNRAKYSTRLLSSPFAMSRLPQSLRFETSVARDHGTYLRKRSSTKEKAKIIIGRKTDSGLSSSTSGRERQKLAGTVNIAASDVMLLDQDENERLQEKIFNDLGDDASDATYITLPTRPRYVLQEERGSKSRCHSTSQNSQFQDLPGCYDDPGTAADQFRTKLGPLGHDKINGISPREANLPSPRILFHPVPRSSKISQIILTSPTIDSSTAGQLGIREPVVPECDKLDDEIWKTWIIQSDVGEQADVDDYQGETEEDAHLSNSNFVSISPGVSVVAPQMIEQHEEKLLSNQNECQARGKHHQYENTFARFHNSTRFAELHDVHKQLLAKKHVPQLDVGVEIAKAQQEGILAVIEQKNNHSHLKVTRQEDPDACWRRFVFPSDYEDEAENSQIKDSISPWTLSIDKSPASTVLAQASSETAQSTKRSLAPSSNFAEPGHSPFSKRPLDENSPRVIRGSHFLETSSTPSTEAQASDSFIVNAPSRSDRETSPEYVTGRLLRRKIVFSKPKPFNSQLHTSGVEALQRDAVHIGRRYGCGNKEGKDEDEDMRHLEDSESIEDD